MPLILVKNDITKMKVDAIVNAANTSLLGGGGVDGAIHKAAGKELLAQCRLLGGCTTGDAKITAGYNLPAKHVIHTVGPVYQDGAHGEQALLESCYNRSLLLAKQNGCQSVAFPLISAGVYGYPKDQALSVAVKTISNFLNSNEMTVYIVIFSNSDYVIDRTVLQNVTQYLADNFAHYSLDRCERRAPIDQKRIMADADDIISDDFYAYGSFPTDLEDELNVKLKTLDEGFSQTLLRKIDQKGLTDVQCYKKANIDRKLFSKIRSDANYRPSKPTVIAFAVSLELTLSETEDLLKKAGFALSRSNKFDVIVEYFISKGIYDVFQINQVLFAFDQALLGG